MHKNLFGKLVKFFFIIYDLLWYLTLPFVVLFLFIKGKKLPGYRLRIGERLGFYHSGQMVDIWFHAVSLGEVIAASALVEACLKFGYRVLITTMTPTGSEQISKMFGERVFHQYCPYDFSFAIRRFLQDRQPKLLMIFETELWPGILKRCAQQHIPIFLANARISDRSYQRYLRTAFFWQIILQYFNKIYVQSLKDKERFLKIGATEQQLILAGNLKFQARIQNSEQLKYWQAFQSSYPQKKFWVVGSTHSGEEEMILDVWDKMHGQYPQVMLILVPRHPERFERVYQLMKKKYTKDSEKLSSWQPAMPIHSLLVDQMGVLSVLYSIASVAFVGGSLVPIGGHNILEPLMYGIPVITGPYMQNQQDLVRILLEEDAIFQTSVQDLPKILNTLFTEDEFLENFKKKSLDIFQKHQGSLEIHVQGIKDTFAV